MDTLFVGTNLMQFASLASTNDFLLEMTRQKSLPEGTIIQAFNQTEGRGQQGNVWSVKPGENLTFSLLLHPKFLVVDQQFKLSKVISIAIVEFLQSLCQPVSIKWPNDIYVGKKKIAGILIENGIEGQKLRQAIVGIGLNVNQIDFSTEILNATSLKIEKKSEMNLDAILSGLCQKMEKWYMKLRNGATDIDSSYAELLFQKDIPAAYEDSKGKFMAILRGVDKQGLLILEDEDGQERFYNFKEVKFLING